MMMLIHLILMLGFSVESAKAGITLHALDSVFSMMKIKKNLCAVNLQRVIKSMLCLFDDLQ